MLTPLPFERIRVGDPRLASGYLVAVAAAILALASLPRALVNADEYYYAGQARMLLDGRALPVEGDALPVPFVSAKLAARYPPGWPAVLALGRAFSFRAMFVVALLVHLAGGIAVARMLVRRGAPTWLNAVYLFHPVFWTFSGTLLSDVPAAVAVLMAMDAWEDGRTWASGVALGVSCLLRLSAVLAAAGFLLAVVTRERKSAIQAIKVAICCAAGVVALTQWNQAVYGTPLSTEYATGSRTLLNGRALLENLLLYSAGLVLMPPFPGAWAVLRRTVVDRWVLVALPVLGFFLVYSYHDSSANPLLTLVGGQRLIIVVHAALLLATARAWTSEPLFERAWVVLPIAAALAIAASATLRAIESPHRAAAMVASRCAPGSIAYNMNAVRAAAAVEAHTYVLLDGRDGTPPADIAIISSRSLSRRPDSRAMRYEGPKPTGVQCVSIGDYQIIDLTGHCELRGEPCVTGR